MKKCWYILLLAFSPLILAIVFTLPALVYGIVTSVFVRVRSDGRETTENISARLFAGKYDRPETSQAENKRSQDPAIHGTAPVILKHFAHKNDSSESISMEASPSDSIDATSGPMTFAPQTPAATPVGPGYIPQTLTSPALRSSATPELWGFPNAAIQEKPRFLSTPG